MNKTSKININLKEVVGKGYKTFWDFKGRYRIVKGSRGSKKSYTVALWYIVNMMKYKEANLLVIRKVAETNKDSTYAQLKTAIRRLGVEDLWHFSKSPIEITYKPTGQKILFRGLDNPLKVTSITVDKGVLCWVWFEEFYEVLNEDDFNKVDMSIRGYVKPPLFKQITATFNPWSDKHWLNKRFFIDKPKNLEELKEKGLTIHGINEDELVMTTNHKINEFLDQADLKIYKKMAKDNPKRYMIEGIGDWGVSEGLIFENWEEKSFDWKAIKEDKKIPATFGLDFGYINDPSAFVCSLVDENEGIIYVFDEFYGKGMSNKNIANKIHEKNYQKESITADSAEQKSIDEIKGLGVSRIHKAQKGADSIMAGIQYIQNFKIYVHPRCVNFITELSMYCWLKSKEGNMINKPIDMYNHGMDAWRYSLERFRAKRSVKVVNINDVL